jgi:2-C-methyl-D-erythritol 4-phosphate cytidylyltransferase
MQTAALVLAAGRGDRLGSPVPKAFVELLGKSLLARSLETLARVSLVDRLVPVIPPDGEALWAGLGSSTTGLCAAAIAGGAERQDSVRLGLAAISVDTRWVAVHDAARCLVSEAEVEAVIRAAQETGAAILARPSTDTLKLVRGDAVASTLDRHVCWVAQTPQVFRVDLLREALDQAAAEGFVGTDDAQLVERLGVSVRVVVGSPRNLKITTPEDLRIAEGLLQ